MQPKLKMTLMTKIMPMMMMLMMMVMTKIMIMMMMMPTTNLIPSNSEDTDH